MEQEKVPVGEGTMKTPEKSRFGKLVSYFIRVGYF
jgi:hypothetical protein